MADMLRKADAGIRVIHSKHLLRKWRRQALRDGGAASTQQILLTRDGDIPQCVRCGGVAPNTSVLGPRVPAQAFGHTSPVSSEFDRYNRCPAGTWVEFATKSSDFEVELCESKHIVPDYMSAWAASGAELFRIGRSAERAGFVYPRDSWSAHAAFRVIREQGSSSQRYRLMLPLFAHVEGVRLTTHDGMPFEEMPPVAPDGADASRRRRVVAFYGSSVTQGCSAEGPASTIPSLVAEFCGIESYNFGFSSSAFGETQIAAYLGALDIDGLVIEYDHNAEVEGLRTTHLPFYRAFRENNPRCAIIFISRASGGLSVSTAEAALRRSIIEETVAYAREHGDARVAFVNGDEIVPAVERWRYFADDRHPNQLGIERIARAIAAPLCDLLAEVGNR